MIKDRIENIDRYVINDFFKELANYLLKRNDVINLKEIPLSYETRLHDLTKFENHERNIDVHVIFEGNERIGISDKSSSEPNMDYDEDNDYQLFNGRPQSNIDLYEGEFLILYPGELHVTGGLIGEKVTTVKSVFKIPID